MIECILLNSLTLAADADLGASLFQFLILFAPLFAIWYFLVIRPQQQQRRKVQDMLANLKTGDRVVTSGGLYGTVISFRDGVVQLQIANQVRVDVARSAITGLASAEGSSETAPSREAAPKEKAGKGAK